MDVPAYYRITDPVQSLKLKICLKRVKKAQRKRGDGFDDSGDEDEHSHAGSAFSDDDGEKTKRGDGDGDHTEWTRTFEWQEKVFGPRELLRYRPGGVDGESGTEDDVLGRTAIEMEYRNELKSADFGQIVRDHVDSAMLFTYTDKDGFVPRNELNKFVSTSENFVLNPLAESILLLPKRADDQSNLRAKAQVDLKLKLKLNSNVLESEAQEDVAKGQWFSSGSAGKRLFRENPCKVFYVMAAVDVNMDAFSKKRVKKDANPSFYEVPLCRVTVNREGSLIEFKPDLSSPKLFQDEDTTNGIQEKKYRFTTPAGSVFEYSLSNVAGDHDEDTAAQLRSIQKEKERIALNEIQNRIERGLVGKVKQPGKTRFHVLIEVVSATAFDVDQLYVQFEVHLPASKQWAWCNGKEETSSEKKIKGVSQTVQTRVNQEGNVVAYLCYPIELEMVYTGQPNQIESFRVPHLLVQVKSRDRWERHRAEGYGFLRLPVKAGSYTRNLKTWKVGGTIRQKLSEHLIGGALHLDNPVYVAIPEMSRGGSFLNRYGFSTDSSGSVQLRLNVIKQIYLPEDVKTELEQRRFRSRSVGEKELSNWSSSKKIRSVEEIMESLKLGFSRSKSKSGKGSELMKAVNKFKEGADADDLRQQRHDELEAQKREEDSRRASIKARLDSMKKRIQRRRSVSAGDASPGNDDDLSTPLLDDTDL